MLIHRANTFRLYPTPEQARKMAQFVGACRFVYNLALEQRRDWYRPGRRFDCSSQNRELAILRSEVDWLKDAPSSALQAAIKDASGGQLNAAI